MHHLRLLRRARALTLIDLALLSGIPARVIAEAEYGMRRLNPHEAEAIAFVLGLSPAALLPSRPPQSPLPQLEGTPLVLVAGLAATLALSLPIVDVMSDWQRHGQAVILQQAGALARAVLPEPTQLPVAPAALPESPVIDSPMPARLALTPTPDALAPLIAPAPRNPLPMAPARFYLDEAGPHGCPVQPVSGQVVITQGYGVGTHAPAHIWGAIDLAIDSDGDGVAEPGASWYAPVVATHDGVVKVTMNSYPAGHHIWVLAPDQVWRTGYSHLAIVTVSDGQRVRAGETIGLLGSTGFASGPHLDYQIWRGDVNIDPTNLVGCQPASDNGG
ncbi:peptidoglycan DD-metalloendopeptidase family protein [Chloroflexus sp.]|uniref:peptidoglycan DD-metalloendopeptidase family protein n=1 Tax=Chloroflexus sp. TaxID=1904827 RepID=UPI00262063EC|nr:peptidoglycan DD-metalloendopeptidase family protein [uncultured Chloroflexus sp.]